MERKAVIAVLRVERRAGVRSRGVLRIADEVTIKAILVEVLVDASTVLLGGDCGGVVVVACVCYS